MRAGYKRLYCSSGALGECRCARNQPLMNIEPLISQPELQINQLTTKNSWIQLLFKGPLHRHSTISPNLKSQLLISLFGVYFFFFFFSKRAKFFIEFSDSSHKISWTGSINLSSHLFTFPQYLNWT